ncbi:MAG: hypothetical protein K2X50_02560 [Gammaproteobacteria bacterium]|nr:hypothetical protein [Gammaproteobacteria bacterium]
MKKKVFLFLLASTIASSAAYAREEFYAEIDGGYDKSLAKGPSDYANMRLGVGTHLFKSEKSKNYFGVEGHLGTNLTGSVWGRHNTPFSVDSFNYYTADIAGLIGYETNNHTDIALKLGIRCDAYDHEVGTHAMIVPQIGIGLGIPVADQLKLTTEVNYRFVGTSANVGLRYTF